MDITKWLKSNNEKHIYTLGDKYLSGKQNKLKSRGVLIVTEKHIYTQGLTYIFKGKSLARYKDNRLQRLSNVKDVYQKKLFSRVLGSLIVLLGLAIIVIALLVTSFLKPSIIITVSLVILGSLIVLIGVTELRKIYLVIDTINGAIIADLSWYKSEQIVEFVKYINYTREMLYMAS